MDQNEGDVYYMKNICEQIDFILQGGLWEKLTEELAVFTSSALIVEIKNDDVIVIEAVNTAITKLEYKGLGRELLSRSPESNSIHKLYFDSFPIQVIPQLGEWKNAVRFHVKEWDIYILLKEPPSQELLDAAKPYLKVIAHWFSLGHAAQLEERLSTLSYMILATKNTLASIFEPMSIDYYAEFLLDVLKESLFPQKLAIYTDDGASISLLKGDNLGYPSRKGIFASKILSPTPVVYKSDEAEKAGLYSQFGSGASVFILPIISTVADEHNYRLFCIGIWEKTNTHEILNFLELLGNVASKALEIKHLHAATEERAKQLDSRSYNVATLYNVFEKLVSHNERLDLLSFLLGFFCESSQAEKVKLVVYDSNEGKYILVGESFGGITAQSFDPLTNVMERIAGEEDREIDERKLAFLGFRFKDMPECKAYPFWVDGKLEGFVAMHGMKSSPEIYDYTAICCTVCQIAARELYFRFHR